MSAILKLKVCGMRNEENMLHVARYKPDFMGFIFYRQSPRFVGENFCIPADFPEDVKRVGVFVNESNLEIIKHIENHKLDFIQLHGSESIDQVKELKDMDCKIIKAFSIDDVFDFESTNAYSLYVDYFLFDTKGKFYGGNSVRFNWEVLKDYRGEVPFFLSGGIMLHHMQEILQINHPKLYAIDVNSGIEISPGIKDIGKIDQMKNSLTTHILTL
jgi:phosphoribosylanthranilate isomerase